MFKLELFYCSYNMYTAMEPKRPALVFQEIHFLPQKLVIIRSAHLEYDEPTECPWA